MSHFHSKAMGEVRIKFFNSPVDYFYYELFIIDGEKYRNDDLVVDERDLISSKIKDKKSPTIKNAIQCVYKNEVVSRRQLSAPEIHELLVLLRSLEFKVALRQDTPCLVMPDVPQRLYLETVQMYVEFWWLSSDEESSPNDLRNLLKLAEMIHGLLDVDTTGMDMPKYL